MRSQVMSVGSVSYQIRQFQPESPKKIENQELDEEQTGGRVAALAVAGAATVAESMMAVAATVAAIFFFTGILVARLDPQAQSAELRWG